MLKLAFADLTPKSFTATTPDSAPLGGSSSALCYLARALVHRGHRVTIYTGTTSSCVADGVACLGHGELTPDKLHRSAFDVLILQNSVSNARWLRSAGLPSQTRLVLWTQHDVDQPAVKPLEDEDVRDCFDRFAFVSEWQQCRYHDRFNVDSQKSVILRNAIAPCFEGMYRPEDRILDYKRMPPVLAYTSTPFRGLELLVSLFPKIPRAIPGAWLAVYSDMQTYQVDQQSDEANYGHLYRRCRETEGVEYFGSIAQPQLAAELKQVAILAYPNTFPETSCIAAMEALAAGCFVVTSDLGALRETSQGFSRLVSWEGGLQSYLQGFYDQIVDVARRIARDPAAANAHLRNQVDAFQTMTWEGRAGEWETWLNRLVRDVSA